MTSFALGFRLGWFRLRKWLLVSLLLGAATTVLGMLLEYRAGSAYAVDRALLGTTFGVVVPLVAYFGARRLYPQGAFGAVDELSRYGASRRSALLGFGAALSLAATGLSGAFVALTLLGKLGRADLLGDLVTSSGIAVQAGISYVAWFTLAASFGRRGPLLALLADWLLGASSGAIALPWPRAHLRNLLGGAPVFELEQSTSSGILLAQIVFCLLLLQLRTPR